MKILFVILLLAALLLAFTYYAYCLAFRAPARNEAEQRASPVIIMLLTEHRYKFSFMDTKAVVFAISAAAANSPGTSGTTPW